TSPGTRDGDYFQLDDAGKHSVISLETGESHAIPERASYFMGVPGLRTAVSGGQPVTLIDLETGRTRAVLAGQVVCEVTGSDGKMLSQPFTPDGKRLATQSLRGAPALNVWEVETGKLLGTVALPFSFSSGALTSFVEAQFSPDGKRMSYNFNDRFRVLDI